jgi:hypothetical protein
VQAAASIAAISNPRPEVTSPFVISLSGAFNAPVLNPLRAAGKARCQAIEPILVRVSTSLRQVIALVGVASAVLAAYVANSPRLDRFGDSATYESMASSLPGSFISTNRMPGYPVLIAISSWFPGGRGAGLIVTQAILILAAVVATYVIARAATGHDWIAFLTALAIAGDLLMAGYVRVVMSETLAVILALAMTIAIVRYLVDFRPSDLWLTAGLLVALTLTRPDWALVIVVLIPYVLLIAYRRRRLNRSVLAHGAAAIAVVLLAIGAYCTGNLIVNGYFGLSSVGNVALLGKVMVYDMVDEAPARYSYLVPIVKSSNSPWDLVGSPPLNDRNFSLAGDFAKAIIIHDPLRFGQDAMGTAFTTVGEHDSVFIVIRPDGLFGRPLQVLLVIDQLRYRGFLIVPALALAWVIAGVILAGINRRAEVMGVLGLLILYSWLTTSAATFGEFERVRMPINPLETIVVIGTLLLFLLIGLRDASRRIPAFALVAIDLVAIGFLPHISSTLLSEVALVALTALQAFAIIRWSARLTAADA